MVKNEHPLEALMDYLPEGAFQRVVEYLQKHKVHLTITQNRKSVLGDYRHALNNLNHRISVNGNLNTYEFLITFLHELAHLLTYEQFGNRVEAHGKEWKQNFGALLIEFMQLNIFPSDIQEALLKTIHNPAATANGEVKLLQVLRRYNPSNHPSLVQISALRDGEYFVALKGKIFIRGKKRRTRFECKEMSTGHIYLFHALAEVKRYSLEAK